MKTKKNSFIYKTGLAAAILIAGVFGFLFGNGGEQSEPVSQVIESAAESGLSFRNKDLLMDHYEKHGKDMGFASPQEYAAAANAVVNNEASLHKLEAEDGDDVYYLEQSNEFVIVSTDGYIRTYFCPEDGLDYYNRQ